MAAPSPITSAMAGVPASNLAGSGAKVVPAKLTVWIMSPPPCQGGIDSRRADRPQRSPTPVGPNILWPEQA